MSGEQSEQLNSWIVAVVWKLSLLIVPYGGDRFRDGNFTQELMLLEDIL